MAKNWAKDESQSGTGFGMGGGTGSSSNSDDPGAALLEGKAAASPYNSSGCFQQGEEVLQRITLTTISWPQNPFLYSTGSLVSVDNNVTLFYTVQMRSCGQQVVANNLASDAIRMTFRLAADTV